ncbi:hypothetical protein [Paenibacillus dendritiformis]|nr:hypothetical protein [Paenibacillus dendritiformis]CAH8772125.1 hypothetical protein H7S4_004863 [Paenibacillus dendritiformis]
MRGHRRAAQERQRTDGGHPGEARTAAVNGDSGCHVTVPNEKIGGTA